MKRKLIYPYKSQQDKTISFPVELQGKRTHKFRKDRQADIEKYKYKLLKRRSMNKKSLPDEIPKGLQVSIWHQSRWARKLLINEENALVK